MIEHSDLQSVASQIRVSVTTEQPYKETAGTPFSLGIRDFKFQTTSQPLLAN